MKEFVALKTKTYSYLMDEGSENKKAKGTIKCVVKRNLKFDTNQCANKISHLEKNAIDVNSLKKIIKNSQKQ